MLGAEVEHLLGLGDAADVGACQHPRLAREPADAERRRVRGKADVDQDAVRLEEPQDAVEVDAVGHGAEDQVEAAAELPHAGVVLGGDVVRGAEAEAVVTLGERAAQHDRLGAQRGGELHAHVAQPAETDDANALTGARAPALERVVRGDARAHERRGLLERHAVGHVHQVVLLDGDALRVAAGGGEAVAADARVGPDGRRGSGAELLLALLAHVALAAGVDEAPDADAVADLELRHLGADLAHDACDLVPGNQRVVHAPPLAARGVDVGVADARVADVEVDLGGPGLAPGDGGLLVATGRRIDGVSGNLGHASLLKAGVQETLPPHAP